MQLRSGDLVELVLFLRLLRLRKRLRACSGLDIFKRICLRIPTRSSSTLCWIPLDVSMYLQSNDTANDFPSEFIHKFMIKPLEVWKLKGRFNRDAIDSEIVSGNWQRRASLLLSTQKICLCWHVRSSKNIIGAGCWSLRSISRWIPPILRIVNNNKTASLSLSAASCAQVQLANLRKHENSISQFNLNRPESIMQLQQQRGASDVSFIHLRLMKSMGGFISVLTQHLFGGQKQLIYT